MKKITCLFLALVMLLSLCACGGESNTTTDNNTPQNNDTATTIPEDTAEPEAGTAEYELGDTIYADNWEFTLTNAIVGTNLNTSSTSADDYLIVDGNYPTTITGADMKKYNKAYVAEDGRAFVAIAYRIKYTGKEAITYNQPISIDYDNGYIFRGHLYSNDDFNIKVDGRFNAKTYFSFEPLSPEYECRSVFDVPVEVMENTDKSLKVIFKTSIDGVSTECAYIVR